MLLRVAATSSTRERHTQGGDPVYRHKYRGILSPQRQRVRCTQSGGAPVIFTVTKKARPRQSSDLNFKAWDNTEAACGYPLRLLLVFNIRGRLRRGATGVGCCPAFPSSRAWHVGLGYRAGGLCVRCGFAALGMKEGCSGENVLERQR